MSIRKIFSIIALASVITITGCSNINENNETSEIQKKTQIVEAKGEDKVKLKLDLGAGKLNLSGESKNIMDGEFVYSKPEWKPIINYEVKNKEGQLKITQNASGFKNESVGDKDCNEWNIKVNNNTYMDIEMNLGGGEFKADLSKINLHNLDIGTGAGKLDLDISGDYKQDVKVDIEGGVVKTVVYVPKSMGVKVKAEKGVGEVKADGFIVENENIYKNSKYKKTKYNMEVNIEAGVGGIIIKQK